MLKGLWRRLTSVLRGKPEVPRVAARESRRETAHYERPSPIPVEAPAERPIPALPIVFFNVGLDFGTSSTKVVVRDVLVGQSYVYALHPGLPGYPSYALPSAVRIHDDRIWFGPEAERRQGGRVFRSFKICLACQSHVGNCRGCETSEADAGRLGRFLLASSDPIDARELVTLYLAYVIATVRAAIRKRFAIGRDVRLTYNMCLPIDQFEAGPGREAFVRALFLAEKLADSIRDGVWVKAAREAYRTIDAQYPVTRDEKERQTFVQPEAVA